MNIPKFLKNLKSGSLITLLVLGAIAISLQTYFADGGQYTRYNNYVIFKQSFEHLLSNKNLYTNFPGEHYDLFKYSPSFSLFMGLFYYLPDWLGVIFFNLLNTVVFLKSVKRLKFSDNVLALFLLYLFVEAGISLTSNQTNLLMAGLIILAFTYFEDDRPVMSSLCIVLSVFIKLFGIVAFAMWLLYPKKIKFLLITVIWFLIIGMIPCLFISTKSLLGQYNNWSLLLKQDHDASYGVSIMGLFSSWLKLAIPKIYVVAVGAFIFLLPFLRVNWYQSKLFRLHILSSVLIWVVIFNHKGESPTYIIAMSGVAIWYFSQKSTLLNKLLLMSCLIFTSFSSTDMITPGWITSRYVEPFSVISLFCVIVWMKLIFDLTLRPQILMPPEIQRIKKSVLLN